MCKDSTKAVGGQQTFFKKKIYYALHSQMYKNVMISFQSYTLA